MNNVSWDEAHVRLKFFPHEAEAILNLPLNRLGGDDIRFWLFSKSGKYSVNERYHLECNSFGTLPFQSKSPDVKLWNILWRMRIPPKIRIFMWRAVRDLIPSQANLGVRHVVFGGSCFLCNFYYASTAHSILFGPLVHHI